MLSTNEKLYKRVLQLDTVKDKLSNTIEWDKFFDSQSVYKLLYTLQIIEAVMEEGEGEDERIKIIKEEEKQNKKNIPNAPEMLRTN